MSYDQSYPFPQVFLVDGSGGPEHSAQPPGLIPCWSFPPALERSRGREKSRGCMGISPGLAMVVLLLFLLVFAALGFEAYQIMNIQTQLRDLREVEPVTEFIAPQKQIGEPGKHGEDKTNRPAAHVIGRIEKVVFPHTLRWESKTGQAFISGGITYWVEDGALQVNETGLYHIYSRVELLFKGCTPTTAFDHSMFVRRRGHAVPVTLMEAHKAGFCPHQKPSLSWTTESYLSSVHKLTKYDRVYVNVSHPNEISDAHNGNFFGLYKI